MLQECVAPGGKTTGTAGRAARRSPPRAQGVRVTSTPRPMTMKCRGASSAIARRIRLSAVSASFAFAKRAVGEARGAHVSSTMLQTPTATQGESTSSIGETPRSGGLSFALRSAHTETACMGGAMRDAGAGLGMTDAVSAMAFT